MRSSPPPNDLSYRMQFRISVIPPRLGSKLLLGPTIRLNVIHQQLFSYTRGRDPLFHFLTRLMYQHTKTMKISLIPFLHEPQAMLSLRSYLRLLVLDQRRSTICSSRCTAQIKGCRSALEMLLLPSLASFRTPSSTALECHLSEVPI
jgi:hypothetical protein